MAKRRARYALRSVGPLPGSATKGALPSAVPNLVPGYKYKFTLQAGAEGGHPSHSAGDVASGACGSSSGWSEPAYGSAFSSLMSEAQVY